MSHSRIYQIAIKVIPEEDYLLADHFLDHWFTNTVADYVEDNTDRASDIRWFKEILGDSARFETDNSFVIQPGGKEKYLQTAYLSFENACLTALSIDLTKFATINSISMLLFDINKAFCDEYSFYVSSDTFGLIPLDEFIRSAEIGKRYFIGGTLEYHL